jgi:streptomycin 6-kinase
MLSIFDWLRTRLDDDQLTDLRPGTTVAPAEERQAAQNLLSDLVRGHTPGLCHGDASLSNILASGADGWRLIDPRGMSGESAYDVAVLAVRIVRALNSSDIVPFIAETAIVDADRVKAWMSIADAARV